MSLLILVNIDFCGSSFPFLTHSYYLGDGPATEPLLTAVPTGSQSIADTRQLSGTGSKPPTAVTGNLSAAYLPAQRLELLPGLL